MAKSKTGNDCAHNPVQEQAALALVDHAIFIPIILRH